MAIYEYNCASCGAVYEVMVSMSNSDSPTSCPRCSSTGVRVPSVFASTEDSKLRIPGSTPFRELLTPVIEVRPAPDIENLAPRMQALEQAVSCLADLVKDRFSQQTCLFSAEGDAQRVEELQGRMGELLQDLEIAMSRQAERAEEAKAETRQRDEELSAQLQRQAGIWFDDLKSDLSAQRDEMRLAIARAGNESSATIRQTAQEQMQCTAGQLREFELAMSSQAEDDRVAAAKASEEMSSRLQHQAKVMFEDLKTDLAAQREETRLAIARVAEEALLSFRQGAGLAQADLHGQLVGSIDTAKAAITKAGDESAATVRQSAHELRQELDRFLKEGMDLASQREETRLAIARVVEEALLSFRQGAGLAQANLQSQLVGSIDAAKGAITKAGDESAATVRQSAQELRRELDKLLKEVMDLAAKAGRIEGKIHSYEWLERLLVLSEGRNNLSSAEVKALAHTTLGSLRTWASRHDSAFPSGARDDLDRTIQAFEEMRD